MPLKGALGIISKIIRGSKGKPAARLLIAKKGSKTAFLRTTKAPPKGNPNRKYLNTRADRPEVVDLTNEDRATRGINTFLDKKAVIPANPFTKEPARFNTPEYNRTLLEMERMFPGTQDAEEIAFAKSRASTHDVSAREDSRLNESAHFETKTGRGEIPQEPDVEEIRHAKKRRRRELAVAESSFSMQKPLYQMTNPFAGPPVSSKQLAGLKHKIEEGEIALKEARDDYARYMKSPGAQPGSKVEEGLLKNIDKATEDLRWPTNQLEYRTKMGGSHLNELELQYQAGQFRQSATKEKEILDAAVKDFRGPESFFGERYPNRNKKGSDGRSTPEAKAEYSRFMADTRDFRRRALSSLSKLLREANSELPAFRMMTNRDLGRHIHATLNDLKWTVTKGGEDLKAVKDWDDFMDLFERGHWTHKGKILVKDVPAWYALGRAEQLMLRNRFSSWPAGARSESALREMAQNPKTAIRYGFTRPLEPAQVEALRDYQAVRTSLRRFGEETGVFKPRTESHSQINPVVQGELASDWKAREVLRDVRDVDIHPLTKPVILDMKNPKNYAQVQTLSNVGGVVDFRSTVKIGEKVKVSKKGTPQSELMKQVAALKKEIPSPGMSAMRESSGMVYRILKLPRVERRAQIIREVEALKARLLSTVPKAYEQAGVPQNVSLFRRYTLEDFLPRSSKRTPPTQDQLNKADAQYRAAVAAQERLAQQFGGWDELKKTREFKLMENILRPALTQS